MLFQLMRAPYDELLRFHIDSSKKELYLFEYNQGDDGQPSQMSKGSAFHGRSAKGRVPFRFRKPECLSRRARIARDRTANRREVRLRSGASGRRLQGHRQYVAVRLLARNKKQAGIQRTRDPTLSAATQ